MPKKPTHGGARKGSGPKPQGDPVEKIGLALRPDVLKKLDALCIAWDCGRSQAVTRMITRAEASQKFDLSDGEK